MSENKKIIFFSVKTQKIVGGSISHILEGEGVAKLLLGFWDRRFAFKFIDIMRTSKIKFISCTQLFVCHKKPWEIINRSNSSSSKQVHFFMLFCWKLYEVFLLPLQQCATLFFTHLTDNVTTEIQPSSPQKWKLKAIYF